MLTANKADDESRWIVLQAPSTGLMRRENKTEQRFFRQENLLRICSDLLRHKVIDSRRVRSLSHPVRAFPEAIAAHQVLDKLRVIATL